MRTTLLVLALLFSNSSVTRAENEDDLPKQRDKKLLSLFSIVTFPNQGCASLDSSRNGTCYTSTECQNKGGVKSGNCAAGFGVCCLFIVTSTSTTINENCTYIQNPSFPSAYTSETALTYTINKCSSDVCSVRLDFEQFTIQGPGDTEEADNTHVCLDSFIASGTSGQKTPVICGMNSGQHIYVEMGNSGSTDTATLAFTFAGSSTVRTWEIKATQIPCGSNYRPPEGCLQYHTELTGRFQTFNFQDSARPQHLANQKYGICIRQEDGYCCIEYSLCADAMSFTLSSHATADGSKHDTHCNEDWVGIAGVTDSCTNAPGHNEHTKLCGGVQAALGNNVPFNTVHTQLNHLGSVCDCTAPFIVEIVTDATQGVVVKVQRGVCLEYRQVPCSG